MSASLARHGWLAASGLAARRLVRAPGVALAVLALSTSLTVALVERVAAPLTAPDRTVSAVVGVVVPLLSFGLLALATGRTRLAEASWPIARFGAPRGQVALGLVATAMIASALWSAVCVSLAVWLAYGGIAGTAQDVLTSSWIAALGAASYCGWFALGGCWLRRGRGRWIVLVADLVLGAGSGLAAAIWPRAHLHSLVGGEAVLGLAQAPSSVALLAMALATALSAAIVVGR
jgi:hypothetical protein